MAAATAALIGLSAVSTATKLRANKRDAQIQANIANFNAQTSKREAEFAIDVASERADDARERTQEIISSFRASLGASNIVTTSGSPMLAQLKQAELGETAAQDILAEGRLKAAGFSAQASLDKFQASAIRQRAKTERSQLLLSGLSKGLGTAASLRSN